MSSATSIEESGHGTHPTRDADPGLRPWQFFLLAGMLSATAVVLVSTGQSPASIVVLSLTVVAASFVALGAYRSLAPLVVPGAAEAPPLIVGQTRVALEREKALVLRSIKELEFDFAMKKVAQADFDEMSSRLRARAIGLMRQLDTGGGYRQTIEAELRQRLKPGAPGAQGAQGAQGASAPGAPGAPGAGAAPGAAAPGAPSAPSAPGAPGAAAACSCGTLNDRDARFCKNCGNKLAA
jgi:hypothetical protein